MSYTLFRNLHKTITCIQSIRLESTISNLTQNENALRPPIRQWNEIIREAEKIVGYPTSFMNLRWLLSDEFANLAMHLRKIVGSNHPIVQTARNFLHSEQNNLQPWGLAILLLSKAISSPVNNLESTKIQEKQRMLAELTEMIRTGHYIHKGLLNLPIEKRDKAMEASIFGNKIAILIGDYLLASANGMLARLRNQDLSYLISTALRDLSEGEFYGERDEQNMPLPGKPRKQKCDSFKISCDTVPLDVTDVLGSPKKEWVLRTMYNGGSLFGRGCQGTVMLADKSIDEQKTAYLFGCHLCLAWQASSELHNFLDNSKQIYSLVSAPVLFAINENPSLFKSIENIQNIENIDFLNLKSKVLDTSAINKTTMLYKENAAKAKRYIEMFGDNQSIDTIKKLIENTDPRIEVEYPEKVDGIGSRLRTFARKITESCF